LTHRVNVSHLTRHVICEADVTTGKPQSPDLSNAQANIQAAKQSAGAYFSSWGSWAAEKRKGWGNKTPGSSPGPLSPDLKRAEDFRKEKEKALGEEQDMKRNSLFFDAEGEEKVTSDRKI
jgi:hypothetical protein